MEVVEMRRVIMVYFGIQKGFHGEFLWKNDFPKASMRGVR